MMTKSHFEVFLSEQFMVSGAILVKNLFQFINFSVLYKMASLDKIHISATKYAKCIKLLVQRNSSLHLDAVVVLFQIMKLKLLI